MTIVEQSRSFEVRSDDGKLIKLFAFDDNASRRAISGSVERKQALQDAKAYAGEGCAMIIRGSRE